MCKLVYVFGHAYIMPQIAADFLEHLHSKVAHYRKIYSFGGNLRTSTHFSLDMPCVMR